MKVIKNCILLLKAEKSDDSSEDKFEVTLKQQGYQVKHIKTLNFVYNNILELKEKLEQSDLYDGIIFTTPRAVQAVNEATVHCTSNWKDKSNYVVGETTYDLVVNKLNLNCCGQESGNAKNLAEVITKDKQKLRKPLLFPCGNLKTDTLTNRLIEEGIDVESLTVYETVTNDNLNEEFCEATSSFNDIPEYWVYFSPSGVKGTLEYISKLSTILNMIKFVAIGPTTENALKENNISVESVAAKPTPEELLKSIQSNC